MKKIALGLAGVLGLSGCFGYGRRLDKLEKGTTYHGLLWKSQIDADQKFADTLNQMARIVNSHISDTSIHTSTTTIVAAIKEGNLNYERKETTRRNRAKQNQTTK